VCPSGCLVSDHSTNLRLLVGTFRPLIFKLIVEIVELINPVFIIFYLLLLFFASLFVFHSFSSVYGFN
jgi:hypothetical protein